jgi:hypothetical protein
VILPTHLHVIMHSVGLHHQNHIILSRYVFLREKRICSTVFYLKEEEKLRADHLFHWQVGPASQNK